MRYREYNSSEYIAQGFRSAMNKFGDNYGINFSASQSSGSVTFGYKNLKYSLKFGKINNHHSATLEALVSDSEGKSWTEISDINMKIKRSKTGRISEQYYMGFIKQDVLPRLLKLTNSK